MIGWVFQNSALSVKISLKFYTPSRGHQINIIIAIKFFSQRPCFGSSSKQRLSSWRGYRRRRKLFLGHPVQRTTNKAQLQGYNSSCGRHFACLGNVRRSRDCVTSIDKREWGIPDRLCDTWPLRRRWWTLWDHISQQSTRKLLLKRHKKTPVLLFDASRW